MQLCSLLLRCDCSFRPTPRLSPLILACPSLSAGVDYYSTRVTIPENAFEMNFVFSNGDGVYDNNAGQVCMCVVPGTLLCVQPSAALGLPRVPSPLEF